MVISRIAECSPSKPSRLLFEKLQYIVLHRISFAEKKPDNPEPIPDSLLDGVELTKREKKIPGVGRCPYHFLIRTGGTIEQLLPLTVTGAHAMGYNKISIAVALVGDFTKHEPTRAQIQSAIELLPVLVPINRGLVMGGHTSFDGASADEMKVCPGPYLDIVSLRARVTGRLQETPEWRTWDEQRVRYNLLQKGIHV